MEKSTDAGQKQEISIKIPKAVKKLLEKIAFSKLFSFKLAQQTQHHVMSLRSPSSEYFNLTAEAAEQGMDRQVHRMADAIKDEAQKKNFLAEMEGFKMLFRKYLRKDSISWAKIKPPSANFIIPHSQLPECKPENASKLASKLAVLKLNGGLGTTMGCVGPKSVIEVRGDQSFLDLTVKQIKVNTDTTYSIVVIALIPQFRLSDLIQKNFSRCCKINL
jgi:UDP-N-acetylglucosamine pyrophosphorylase